MGQKKTSQSKNTAGANPRFAKFSRKTPHKRLKMLVTQPLFTGRLKADIDKCAKKSKKGQNAKKATSSNVFPALRRDRVDFYHLNGKFLSYCSAGFESHLKYASVFLGDGKSSCLRESSLGAGGGSNPISSFTQGYDRMMGACALYAGDEGKGVADLCNKFSYAHSTEHVVVLDIEVAFMEWCKKDKKNSYGWRQRRIDVLLYHLPSRTLLFVEAKHFSNNEIAWNGKTAPKVVQQARTYRDCLVGAQQSVILSAYKDYIDRANQFLRISGLPALPFPQKVCRQVPVFIFGFDRVWQKNVFTGKGKLQDEIEMAKGSTCGVPCYGRGSTKDVTSDTLWRELRKAVKRVDPKALP